MLKLTYILAGIITAFIAIGLGCSIDEISNVEAQSSLLSSSCDSTSHKCSTVFSIRVPRCLSAPNESREFAMAVPINVVEQTFQTTPIVWFGTDKGGSYPATELFDHDPDGNLILVATPVPSALSLRADVPITRLIISHADGVRFGPPALRDGGVRCATYQEHFNSTTVINGTTTTRFDFSGAALCAPDQMHQFRIWGMYDPRGDFTRRLETTMTATFAEPQLVNMFFVRKTKKVSVCRGASTEGLSQCIQTKVRPDETRYDGVFAHQYEGQPLSAFDIVWANMASANYQAFSGCFRFVQP